MLVFGFEIRINNNAIHWDKTYTVKSFNFLGTKFHGLRTMDMFMDTWTPGI